MNKKLFYTKLGTAAFATPSVIDAALVYFDIPDTTLPSPTVLTLEDDYVAIGFDLSTGTAVHYSYIGGSYSKTVLTGSTSPDFTPTIGVYGGVGNESSWITASAFENGKVNSQDAGGYYMQAVGTSTKAFPSKGDQPNEYADFADFYPGDGLYTSPYFPADGSINYIYFESTQAQYGWLEASMNASGEVTIYGVYYEPIPESSTNLAIATTLAGSAFIYSRRKRRKAAGKGTEA